MAIRVTRKGAAVTAVDIIGMVARTFLCRSSAAAVELADKLTDDQAFADRWILEGDKASSQARQPHHHERPYE